MWQGGPTAATITVDEGIPISDEGFSYTETLPNGLAIAGPFLIQAAPDQTVVDFSTRAERPFLYTGGMYTTTVSGSATFSDNVSIGGGGYVSIFAIPGGSIYTQSGFVTPAGTASTHKAPGNVPIITSPNITMPADTTSALEVDAESWLRGVPRRSGGREGTHPRRDCVGQLACDHDDQCCSRTAVTWAGHRHGHVSVHVLETGKETGSAVSHAATGAWLQLQSLPFWDRRAVFEARRLFRPLTRDPTPMLLLVSARGFRPRGAG